MSREGKEDTVEETSLRECPFCEVSDCLTMPSHAAREWVQCNNIDCQAEGPARDTREEAIAAWNTRPQSTVTEEMIEALQVCANKFWEYVIIHEAKKTPDGQEKADRNREMAEMCDAALSPSGPSRKCVSSLRVSIGARTR